MKNLVGGCVGTCGENRSGGGCGGVNVDSVEEVVVFKRSGILDMEKIAVFFPMYADSHGVLT